MAWAIQSRNEAFLSTKARNLMSTYLNIGNWYSLLFKEHPCRLLDLNTHSLDEEIPYFTVIKELSFHYKQYCFFTIKLK